MRRGIGNSPCKDLASLVSNALKVVAWWGDGLTEPCHLSLGGGSEAYVIFDPPRSAKVVIDVCQSMPVPVFVEKYLGSSQEDGFGELIIEARGSVAVITFDNPDAVLDALRWMGVRGAVVENGHVVVKPNKGLHEFGENLKKVLRAFVTFKKFLSTSRSVEVPEHAKKVVKALNAFSQPLEGDAEVEVRTERHGSVAYYREQARVYTSVKMKITARNAEDLVPIVAGLVVRTISCADAET